MPVSIITDVIVSHAKIQQFLVAKLGFDILRENGLPSIQSIEVLLHLITFIKDFCHLERGFMIVPIFIGVDLVANSRCDFRQLLVEVFLLACHKD